MIGLTLCDNNVRLVVFWKGHDLEIFSFLFQHRSIHEFNCTGLNILVSLSLAGLILADSIIFCERE